MKSHARVVVIGGGAMGVGLLYHLAKEGWNDVMLIEKGELTSGSTWHAAGLVPHFIGSLNMAKVHRYGSELYQVLEEETGQATGWHGCGAIRLAVKQDEIDWFQYVQGVLKLAGSECHLVGPDEIKKLNPLLDTNGVLMGAYTPNDGHTDPSGITNAMAVGAKMHGAEIIRHNLVTDINRTVRGIEVNKDTMAFETMQQVCTEGPGHYLGHEQTLSRMQSDYLYPELGDRENINNWIDQGSSNIEERASQRAREIIESHFPDHIDPEIEMRIRNEFPVRVQTGPSQTIEPRVA